MIEQKFRWMFQRAYSQEKFRRITTHYTIIPRESDPRWKGIIYKYEIEYEKTILFINNIHYYIINIYYCMIIQASNIICRCKYGKICR